MAQEKEKGRYDDIIHLPRPVSKKRQRMSDLDRAAQFSPFAALVGYDAAIREEARLTWAKKELAEDEKVLLDRKYRFLLEHIQSRPQVTLTYFLPDISKNGGAYVTLSGRVVDIRAREQWLRLESGEHIPFADIRQLELEQRSEANVFV